MSTAVYYSNHNIPVEDLPPKQHTLPSLSQIMPPVQGQPAPYTHENSNSPNPNNGSPSLNYNSGYQQQSHPQLPPQPTPDAYSQGSSSTNQSTPVSSTYSYGQPQPTSDGSIIGAIPRDKCICKSNANRIPRPRNAFILFRQKYHQTVLDEGSVIRTNPEVSRELGRRWRALSPEEKEHWNNLAEEEKKNHAAKYPGYRYTPRRNGKNKNCIVCREKAMRQQQQQQAQQVKQAQLVQMQNQQIIQMHQDQYQQYMHLQQQQQMQQQSQQHQIPLNGYQQQSYIISNPYQPGLMSTSSSTALPLPQQNGQITQGQAPPHSHSVSSTGSLQYYDSEKLSPLSAQQQQQQQSGAAGQPQTQPIQVGSNGNYSTLPPTTSTSANGILQHPAGSGNEYISSYDQHQRYVQTHHHQPGAPAGNGPAYPFDAFAIQQPPQ
ncbi:Repressor of filamentous growth 1 [Spathaspora sp. JA1]|nr:Repressor of filamentous growth 1 [Spathaspora sp. JA1]